MDKKVCIKCGEEKLISEFNKHIKYKSGIRNSCRKCDSIAKKEWKKNNPEKVRESRKRWKKNNPEKVRESRKRWKKNNPEKVRESRKRWRQNNPDKVKIIKEQYKETNPDKVKGLKRKQPIEDKINDGWVCSTCKIRKDITGFYGLNYSSCKECEKLRMKEYREKYPSNRKKTKDKWAKNNPEKVREQRKKYIKRRIKTDPVFREIHFMRSKLNLFFIKNGQYKNEKFEEAIGIDYIGFKNYIESKFLEGMSWDNYSHNGWHLDHIIPLSYSKTVEDVKRLSHYTNLQPLWSKDNIEKSNKILPEFEHLVEEYLGDVHIPPNPNSLRSA